MFRVRAVVSLIIAILAGASSAQDALPLSAISDYLNGIEEAESSFTQYNEDGSRSTGKLYIKRPGRMRLEYDPPNGGVVIAGRGAVVVRDTKSNQPPETYPLKRTPLSIILAPQVDLDQANMVVGHSNDGEFTVVRAQDPENPEYGFIDLKFSAGPVALSQWIITNEQGARTAVVLDGLESGKSLSNDLFNTQGGRGGSNR